MEELIPILLTTPEAVQFREYQKYHDVFMMLQKSGVFDIQYGKCTLNFSEGMLQNVSKEETIYKRLTSKM